MVAVTAPTKLTLASCVCQAGPLVPLCRLRLLLLCDAPLVPLCRLRLLLLCDAPLVPLRGRLLLALDVRGMDLKVLKLQFIGPSFRTGLPTIPDGQNGSAIQPVLWSPNG